MNARISAFLLALTTVLGAHFSASTAQASILPPNNLSSEDSFTPANITEEQFHKIVDSIIDMWQPLARARGVELVAKKDWASSEVNAYASQSGKTWSVIMLGGLARRPEVTPDGFALVVCHELGHHFGGYAFKTGRPIATEGESDYYATQLCARRLWGKSTEKNRELAMRRPVRLQNACDHVWKSEDDRNLCYRTTEAGLSLARLLGALGNEKPPSLETRDTSRVNRTYEAHPRSQCRLDTYLHGALCTQPRDPMVIPGIQIGRNTPEAEAEAAKYSCMEATNFKVGFRPGCWFKALNETSRPQIADDGIDLVLGQDWMSL